MELQPITSTTLTRSREDEEFRLAQPRDIPQVETQRVRPRSLSGNSDLGEGDSLIISPEEISLDPVMVGEETPLEEGSFPDGFGKKENIKPNLLSVGFKRRRCVMHYSLPH